MLRLIFPLSILISSSPFLLNAGFYDRSMEGRYWYDERINDEAETSKENKNISEENALEYLQELKQKFETTKALAVLQPNRENLLKYMTIQNELVMNAEKFAKVWQQILLENPLLNDELTNPTAQYAIQARKAAQYMEIEAFLNSARKKHVLLSSMTLPKNFLKLQVRWFKILLLIPIGKSFLLQLMAKIFQNFQTLKY